MGNIIILCLILIPLLNLQCLKTKRCVTHDASEQTIEIAHEHVHMLIVIQNVIKTQMLNLMLHYVL